MGLTFTQACERLYKHAEQPYPGLYLLPRDRLRPWGGNPQTRQNANRETVKASVQQEGMVDGVLIVPDPSGDFAWIVDGHGRWEIAPEAGIDRLPVDLPNVNGRLDKVYREGGLQKFIADLWAIVGFNRTVQPGAGAVEVALERPSIKKVLPPSRRTMVNQFERTFPDRAQLLELARDDKTSQWSLNEARQTLRYVLAAGQEPTMVQVRRVYLAIRNISGATGKLQRLRLTGRRRPVGQVISDILEGKKKVRHL